ncbi:MAG: bifunctional methylenetetrahydrofolate dehydrogenase/methenyltetrahydrofolate cyclohydrolase FolD [Erysipelotrichaceae bacterium]
MIGKSGKAMQILNGKELSLKLEEGIKQRMIDIQAKQERIPSLVVVLVGDNPASVAYVNNKVKACARVGFISNLIHKDETCSQEELLAIIHTLNHDQSVDGILVQLPLPDHLDPKSVIEAIDPNKDVDGLHPFNVVRLYQNNALFIPCTAKGIMTLLSAYQIELSGKSVVVIGRSQLVGRPVSQLCLNANATVTVCHSKTTDIAQFTKQADVIIVAIGKPKFLNQTHISKQSVIIDVGISKIDGKYSGDVDFESVKDLVLAITPVPGGIGPMTIVSLLQNTLIAYHIQMEKMHG